MKTALIVICIIAAFIFVLLIVPTYVIFDFETHNKNSKFNINIRYLFFNMKMNPKKTPGKKVNTKEKSKKEELPLMEKIEKGIKVYKYIEDDIAEILIYASEHAVKIKNIQFYMNFGLKDAMYTGILTGTSYAAVYNIIALLSNNIAVEKCDVKITPDFEKQHVNIHSRCILKVKNVHIMIIVFKVLKMYFKITKIK